VQRPALVDRLRSQAAPVVAIVAPPGYGKTTTLSLWAAQDRRPFAWLSLDWSHNDPAVLLTYLALALGEVIPVEPAVFEALRAPHPSQRAAIRTALARSAYRTPHPFVLAVDEAHQLTDAEGAEVLRTLAEHLPAGSQLAVAGRREPPLGLARLRSERRVIDIGIGDLRVDVPEARELLAAAGTDLTEPEAAELVARTEGWPVGLYFAAMAGGPHAFPRCRGSAFGGDDRLITDYIRTEFLDHLPPERLRFLTRTSVLDELCGPLCDATLERTGSAATLEEIEASNLLLVPLDRQRRWYRYHHLFQAMLRHKLERLEPAAVPVLARRASRWCEANGLLDSAVGYAQLAGDSGRVGHILLGSAMRFYALGRATTLQRWFEWLADHGPVEGGPAAVGAWLSLVWGRAADAERWAATADKAPHDAGMPDGSPLHAWVLMLHATMARDVHQMRRDAARALQILSPGSQWRPTAASILGMAELFQGNLDAADQQLAETVELAADLGGPAAASLALAARAIIAIRRDRWQQARTLAERASSVTQEAHLQDYASSALTYAVRSRVAAHDGDPWAAREQIAAAGRVLPLLTRALAHLASETRLELARAHLALGDAPSAKDLLSEAGQLLGGCDFGSLHDDTGELSVTAEQIQAASAASPKLTPAELRLLPLLATQLSFREIAGQLFVSVHTVKAQVTSIYRKLAVSSRTQAIERARSLSLLPG
jgi:LuxR family transcriptional regulator, maltose regulon positive regulatory protein